MKININLPTELESRIRCEDSKVALMDLFNTFGLCGNEAVNILSKINLYNFLKSMNRPMSPTEIAEHSGTAEPYYIIEFYEHENVCRRTVQCITGMLTTLRKEGLVKRTEKETEEVVEYRESWEWKEVDDPKFSASNFIKKGCDGKWYEQINYKKPIYRKIVTYEIA